MGHRYQQLSCDFNNPGSVSALVESVLAERLPGAKSFFNVSSDLPFEMVITSDPSYGFDVQVLDEEDGWAGRIMSPNQNKMHRDLEVKRLVQGYEKGSVGHLLLSVINQLEGVLEEENVKGYDLIIFYIREGYVPESRSCGLDDLKKELVHYLKSGKPKPNRQLLPNTKLKRNPEAAAAYWKELKQLSGYEETEKPLKTMWQVHEMFALDADIFDLLMTLEQVPFLATLSSCSGHLSTASVLPFRNAPADRYFCENGHLIFEKTDSKNSQAFMKEVKSLAQRYGNQVEITIDEEEAGYCRMEFLFKGQESEIKRPNPAMKTLYEIDRQVGEAKLDALKDFWCEMSDLAKVYVSDFSEERVEEVRAGLTTAMEGIGLRPAIDDRMGVCRK